ncbi:MAG: OadG family protein [Verrucomicrobia bacterium]|nr:OadG family protein [Verrucomicrobiota bacterium]
MKESVIEAMEHMTGFIIVLMTLGILWGLTALMGKFAIAWERAQNCGKTPNPSTAADKPSPAPVVAVASNADDGPTDEEVVIIAAAVSMMLSGRHRIVSIRAGSSDWSREGRRQIFSSHKIR